MTLTNGNTCTSKDLIPVKSTIPNSDFIAKQQLILFHSHFKIHVHLLIKSY